MLVVAEAGAAPPQPFGRQGLATPGGVVRREGLAALGMTGTAKASSNRICIHAGMVRLVFIVFSLRAG